MSLIRWDPFDDLASLRESMEKLFEEFYTRRPERGGRTPVVWQPAIEAYETDGDVVIRAELPGIDPKQVEISVTEDTLTLKGEARTEHEEKKRNYYRRELRYGAFVRSIALPSGAQGDKASASYRNGILEIKVPKSERAKPKTVKVEVAGE
jgi:HSP20 family protein